MSYTLADGSTLHVAALADYGSPITMSDLSNAAEAVATLTAGHNLVIGDVVEVTSGWGRVDKRIVRVKAVNTVNVTLEKLNTADTSVFAVGGGAGTVRKISKFTEVTQIKSVNTGGGDVQFADATALADTTARSIPASRAATVMNLTLFDDPTLPWYQTLIDIDDRRIPAAMLIRLSNGSRLYANVYVSVQRVPNIERGQALTVPLTITYASDAMRYSS